MIIHTNLGTMPADYYEVKDQIQIEPGERIHVRPSGDHYHGYNWEGAKVDRVSTMDGKPFYFLSRW